MADGERRRGARGNAPPAPGEEWLTNVPKLSVAAQTLKNREAVYDVGYLNRLVKSRVGVHPQIWDFQTAFVKTARAMSVPIIPFELFRSPERQEQLFAQGRSKARAGKSPHNFGCAVDLVHFTRWWDLAQDEWELLGAIGKEIARKQGVKMVWGGEWKFYDPAHWEIADWREHVRIYRAQKLKDWPRVWN